MALFCVSLWISYKFARSSYYKFVHLFMFPVNVYLIFLILQYKKENKGKKMCFHFIKDSQHMRECK